MEQKKIAIIGAGVSGLTAAALLAAKGYKVTVYERSDTYGGKVAELHLGGSTFDSGPSLCTDVDTIDDVFVRCGKNPRDYWAYEKLSELTRYFWMDGMHYTMPQQLPYMERSLVREFQEKPKKVKKYIHTMERMYRGAAPYYLDDTPNVMMLLRPKALKAATLGIPFIVRSLHARNAKYFSSKKVIQLFDRYATYSGNNPHKSPAVIGLAAAPEILTGAYYPKGGMRSIVTALYTLAKDVGTMFVFKAHVTSISQAGSQFHIVHIGKEQHRYDAVVYSGDVVRLYELLGNESKKRAMALQERSMSGVVFCWQVKGSFSIFGLHNIIFSDDYKKEFDDIDVRKQVPSDPTIYINITSKKDDTHAPEGSENWFVMINVPAGLPESAIIGARDIVQHKIESFMGGYLTIEEEHIVSPHSLDATTGAWQGAIYGAAGNSLQRVLRHPNKVKGYDNLYVIGGTVHPGGGIPLTIRSAKIIAEKL